MAEAKCEHDWEERYWLASRYRSCRRCGREQIHRWSERAGGWELIAGEADVTTGELSKCRTCGGSLNASQTGNACQCVGTVRSCGPGDCPRCKSGYGPHGSCRCDGPDPKFANQPPTQPLPKVGSRWRHWKGDTYTVLLVTADEKAGVVLVHYESDWSKAQGRLPWTRPLLAADNAFWGEVPKKDLERHGRIPIVPRVMRFVEVPS